MHAPPSFRALGAAIVLIPALGLAALPAEGWGQAVVPPISLELVPETGAVQIELGEILGSGRIERSLEGGLPVRIGIVTELWRDRLLDSQEGRHEWRATVRYDPLSELYRIEVADGVLGQATALAAVTELLRRQLDVPLGPTAPGTYYYLARIEIETLSLSDVDELRRWLRGELGPAVEGEGEVGGAFAEGIRRLLVRALGLPVERHQARSPRFEWDPP